MVKLSRATSALAEILGLDHQGPSVLVTGVSVSAQQIEPGDLFVAVQGAQHHGLDFLDQAIALGASAVLSDRPTVKLTSLVTSDPKAILGEVCNLVLGENQLRLFGVTGTNGKTSTANYLYQLLERLGERPGLSGSTGMHSQQGVKTKALTTSELTDTRKFLAELERSGSKSAVLEVSAQAMVRNRVSGLRFAVAGFTNLSRDHLDDFGSMEQYFAAKKLLFDSARCSEAVVFVSDSWSQKLLDQLSIPKLAIGPGQEVDYSFEANTIRLSGRLNLELEFGFGELMARNLALAIGMLFTQGFGNEELKTASAGLTQVPGRLELVSERTPHTFVDYAHTPEGISSAVAEISSRYPGVTLVFGASGNRDAGKREQMGAAASAATSVIVTDQHPRDEDPAAIRAAVIRGLVEKGKTYVEEGDPEKALGLALGLTPSDHAILWCGPGHLKYREIDGSKVAFDAISIAKRAVEA